MMLALQARVGRKVSMQLAAVYWPVEYAGELLNMFKREQERRTVRERKI